MKTAIVTASYARDFERCRLLCESIDRFVTGAEKHYLLVAGHDVALFRRLAGHTREVIDERDLLPSWLHNIPDPTAFFRRRVWLSTHTPPLHGWHVQQLRRIAIAEKVQETAFLYCDSDVAFLKPFALSSLWRGEALRLYRRDGALPLDSGLGHEKWHANAGFALALPPQLSAPHEYISNMVHWRRDAVTSMIGHIEQSHGRHWVEAIAARRHFSECLLYGRYIDEALGGRGHFHDDVPLCRTYWFAPAPTDEEFRAFVADMAPEQVAVAVQSFIGVDTDHIRRLIMH
ncbi:DUF6492 family protein [Phyllobacterium leguminum]|uniref:Uncharacterized protein n=1 Tax=Phyllobacterium leguminum TaxID=314237 RepID=A0A318T731_9HYPH|nr:DUF6492 family protein [Phyllobacterium leguminum]PYE90340.1 hypothetical protein C7477_10111 [Phyllobacterium leguminum]